jgi:hypothetical protein
MPASKSTAVRVLRVKPTDDLKTIYAKAKKAFGAAHLQRYTESGKGMSEDQMVAALAAAHREELKKMRKRNKR